jgi:hypothetical protein
MQEICHSDCREEGLAGLWKGVTPNIGRNAIINAAELASYDSVRDIPSHAETESKNYVSHNDAAYCSCAYCCRSSRAS